MTGFTALVEEARVCEHHALVNLVLDRRKGWSHGYVFALLATARRLRRHAAMLDAGRSPFEVTNHVTVAR